MKGYRLQWQTIVGAGLLCLFLAAIFLPGMSFNGGNHGDIVITRLFFAKWCLTTENNSIESTLRLWGWLIYIPFLSGMITVVFMIVKERTFSGALLFDGIAALFCECLAHFLVPSMLWSPGDGEKLSKELIDGSEGLSWILVMTLAVLIIIYSVFCLVLWGRSAAAGNGQGSFEDIAGGERSAEIGFEGESTKRANRITGELQGIKGEYMGQSIGIGAGEEIVLGRDPQYCMLIFSSQKVSRRQCGIRYDAGNGRYQIIDYSSGGTTLPDGRLLATSEYTALLPGAVIYIAGGTEVFMLM